MHGCAPPKKTNPKAPAAEAEMPVQDEIPNFSIFVQFAKAIQC